MRRIPVFATIGRAYSFTLLHLATIVGLIWLPTIVLVSLQYYASMRYVNGFLSAQAQGNLYELNQAIGLRYGTAILALALQAILVTPVMRQALGLRSGGALIGFELSPTALRVFGAMVALALVFIAVEYIVLIPLIVFIAGIFLASRTAGAIHGISPMVIAAWSAGAAVAVAVLVLIFVAVRLSFFVIAVAVAEKKIDLIRAWRLTASNFWRILIILVVTLLPLGVAYLALLWAALGFPYFHALSPALLASWKGAPTKALTWFLGAVTDRLPYVYGVTLLLAPFGVGLSTGAAAAAYRALVPPTQTSGPAETPVPEAPPA